MKWKRIPKENSIQPNSGSYNSWKELIAEEGYHQCVYCAIHDASFGGIRNFHVEHYKPKSLLKFHHLINDITNLYYACPICNTFKSNDWPSDPTDNHSAESYPDPSKIDYCELFEIDLDIGLIKGRYVASKYMIEKMHLNRGQLVIQRRVYNAFVRDEQLRAGVRNLLPKLKHLENKDLIIDLYCRLNDIQDTINSLKNALYEITPYKISETA